MTNKELQDLLKQYPDDMPVEIMQWDQGTTFEIDEVVIDEATKGFGYNFQQYEAIIIK